MSIFRTLAVAAPLTLAFATVVFGPNPFNDKEEIAKARKELDARYAQFYKGVYESDLEQVETVLGTSFWIQYAEYGRDEAEESDDISDFLTAVSEGGAPYVIQKAFTNDSAKSTRKVTSFTAGRTVALQTTLESHQLKFVDEHGAYGEKGKEHTLEMVVSWTDMWGYEINDDVDDEKPNWYLTYRECSGAEVKVDGKPIPPDEELLARLK